VKLFVIFFPFSVTLPFSWGMELANMLLGAGFICRIAIKHFLFALLMNFNSPREMRRFRFLIGGT